MLQQPPPTQTDIKAMLGNIDLAEKSAKQEHKSLLKKWHPDLPKNFGKDVTKEIDALSTVYNNSEKDIKRYRGILGISEGNNLQA